MSPHDLANLMRRLAEGGRTLNSEENLAMAVLAYHVQWRLPDDGTDAVRRIVEMLAKYPTKTV